MRRLYSLFAVVLVVACSEPTSTTPNGGKFPDVLAMTPVSSLQLIGHAGEQATSLPSVRVYNNTALMPVAGASVTFYLRTPTGDTSQVVVATNSNGVATFPAFRLGSSLGRYVVTAAAPGLSTIQFFIFVRGRVIAIYDLIGLEGSQFPTTYASSGHYVLFEDGTYNHVYNDSVDFNSAFLSINGTYIKQPSGGVDFYIEPVAAGAFYASKDYLFSSGSPVGANLRVTYTDPVDFDVEIYAPR